MKLNIVADVIKLLPCERCEFSITECNRGCEYEKLMKRDYLKQKYLEKKRRRIYAGDKS